MLGPMAPMPGVARLVFMTLAAGVLVTGCGIVSIGDPLEPEVPCDCPRTETIVLSIDWLGDGTVATSQDSRGHGPEGEELPYVDLTFTGFDGDAEAAAALGRLVDAIEQGGLDFERHDDREGEVQLEMARVRIGVRYLSNIIPEPKISVNVDLAVEDAEAQAALQPLIDALGTIG